MNLTDRTGRCSPCCAVRVHWSDSIAGRRCVVPGSGSASQRNCLDQTLYQRPTMTPVSSVHVCMIHQMTSIISTQMSINCISASVHSVQSACLNCLAVQTCSLLHQSLTAVLITRWSRPSHSSLLQLFHILAQNSEEIWSVYKTAHLTYKMSPHYQNPKNTSNHKTSLASIPANERGFKSIKFGLFFHQWETATLTYTQRLTALFPGLPG